MEDFKIQMFHDAYIKADSTELDRLWNEEAPSSFIKFYPARYDGEINYFLDNLRSDKLWLSSPRCFNDPFDSVINFDYRHFLLLFILNFCASFTTTELIQFQYRKCFCQFFIYCLVNRKCERIFICIT